MNRDSEATVVFAPHQIVRLECDQAQLYAEVIQVLEARQMGWVRPIMLIYSDPEDNSDCFSGDQDQPQVQPVIDGPDLLWPLNQFHVALDTDVIPLLTLIDGHKAEINASSQSTTCLLQQFIDRLWAQQSSKRGA